MFPSSCPCPKALNKFAHSAFVTEWMACISLSTGVVVFHHHLNKISEITMCVAAPSCGGFSLVSTGFIDFRPMEWQSVCGSTATHLIARKQREKETRIPQSLSRAHFFLIDLRTDTRPNIVKALPPPNDAPLGTFETWASENILDPKYRS